MKDLNEKEKIGISILKDFLQISKAVNWEKVIKDKEILQLVENLPRKIKDLVYKLN